MSSEVFQTVVAVLQLAIAFLAGLFLPLVLQLLLLFLAGWAFWRLVVGSSRTIALLLSLIGVPVHELSHAIGCLITLEGVDAIKLLGDEAYNAFVAPKRENPVGSLVDSIAPLLLGVILLWLTATYIIPGFEVPAATIPQLNPTNLTSLGEVLKGSLSYMWSFLKSAFSNLPNLQWKDWRTWVGLYIALSLSIGIAPSKQDLKIFLRAALIVFALCLPLFAWLYFSGSAEESFVTLQAKLMPAMVKFSTAITTAFLLVSLGVGVSFVLYAWQKLRGR